MLKEMKEQLQRESINDNGGFNAHLRKRIGKRATAQIEERLRKIIVIMPDLVNRSFYYWKRSPQLPTKRLSGHLLTYLYEPKDLISNQEGLFGYLDDAYFVVKVYSAVIEREIIEGRHIKDQDFNYWEEAKHFKKNMQAIIPAEVKHIDRMIDEIIAGENNTFISSFSCSAT